MQAGFLLHAKNKSRKYSDKKDAYFEINSLRPCNFPEIDIITNGSLTLEIYYEQNNFKCYLLVFNNNGW